MTDQELRAMVVELAQAMAARIDAVLGPIISRIEVLECDKRFIDLSDQPDKGQMH